MARQDEFWKELARLKGQICWGALYTTLNSIVLNFGSPIMDISGEGKPPRQATWPMMRRRLAAGKLLRPLDCARIVHIRGRWYVRIWHAYWSIRYEGHLIASTSSALWKIRNACGDLDGQKVSRIDVDSKTAKTRFEFDLGSVLEVRRIDRSPEEELWCVFTPGGYFMAVYGDGTYRRNRSDREPGPHQPIPQQAIWRGHG